MDTTSAVVTTCNYFLRGFKSLCSHLEILKESNASPCLCIWQLIFCDIKTKSVIGATAVYVSDLWINWKFSLTYNIFL